MLPEQARWRGLFPLDWRLRTLPRVDRPMQLPVAAAVLHEADVLSSVQTLKSTSPSRLALFLLRLEARGKLGPESLVAAHDGDCS